MVKEKKLIIQKEIVNSKIESVNLQQLTAAKIYWLHSAFNENLIYI
jgi:hypothetical protein